MLHAITILYTIIIQRMQLIFCINIEYRVLDMIGSSLINHLQVGFGMCHVHYQQREDYFCKILFNI